MANTKAEILARMIAQIPSGLDTSEGSFIYDVLAATVIEIAADYLNADTNLALGFAETTSNIYLDYRAHEHGLTRKSATAATGTVTITGTAGTVVEVGSLFATSGGVQFQTTAAVTIASTGIVSAAAEAVATGISGNVPAAAINVIPVSISGVTAVTNAAATTGGTAEETDVVLLARLLAKVQSPGTSGNKNDYINWAMAVSGVGAVKVLPLWNGAGTVKTVLLGTDMAPASSSIVAAVQAAIDPGGGIGKGEAPVGATVTVVAATAVSIGVTAKITLTSDGVLANVQTAFETLLSEYLTGIAFTDSPTVKYVKVGALLSDTKGVSDYTNLLINGGSANISIADTEVAIIGTVTLA